MIFKIKRKIAVSLIAILSLIFLIGSPLSAATFTNWFSMNSGATNDLNGIWGTANTDVFVVGKAGTIGHFDGAKWSAMSNGTASDFNAVSGTSSTDVFAVGKVGIIEHFDGAVWSLVNSGAAADLNGVFGITGGAVFAAGNSGAIIRYDGTKWNSMDSGTANDLYGIWGSAVTDIFVVGKSGVIGHFDGTKWSLMTGGGAGDLYGVWGSAGNDVFAVGKSGAVLHYDGTKWSPMISGTTSDLNGVWGSSGTDVFVVGKSGTIGHYDGSKWSSMNSGTFNELRGIKGFSSADIFTAGLGGAILRYSPPAVKSLSVNQGDQGAKLNVTVTGINLTGTSDVNFGPGIAVNSFTVLNSQQLTASITIVGGATVGARDVSVTTPGGGFTLPNGFTVMQALPTITSVSPEQDRQGSTPKVTITGSHLAAAGEVRFGSGIAVNAISVLSENQISVDITIAADAAPGFRDVSVTTPAGSYTLVGGFTVNQAVPTIGSISPTQGNRETTLDVTIAGANLTGASEVRFGMGVTVNSLTILSANQLIVNISLAADAEIRTRDVSVTTPGGSFSLPNSFTVKQALPVITSVTPNQGSQGATFTVTIDGANFTGAGEVRLGAGIAVNSFTLLSPNRITASITIVAGAATGSNDVSVTTPGGSFSLPNSFTVKQGLPVISSVLPGQGSQSATLDVIINGDNFDDTTSVTLGAGIIINRFTNLSPIQLRVNVTIDAKAVPGVRDVSVTTLGGKSTLSNGFTIEKKPLGAVLLVLIWVGVGIVVALFVLILNLLRKNKTAKL